MSNEKTMKAHELEYAHCLHCQRVFLFDRDTGTDTCPACKEELYPASKQAVVGEEVACADATPVRTYDLFLDTADPDQEGTGEGRLPKASVSADPCGEGHDLVFEISRTTVVKDRFVVIDVSRATFGGHLSFRNPEYSDIVELFGMIPEEWRKALLQRMNIG